jgi:Arc/MetJ-type ribon-helix-helix transcriptional regulator
VPLNEKLKYKRYTLHDTQYVLAEKEVSNMEKDIEIDEETEEKRRRNLEEDKGKQKKEKYVIKMRFPEDEDKEKVREKVLMRLGKELGDRSNVVMTRLNDDDLKQIDALVEVEAFKSRSEAAAFFIKEGMHARKDLFQKVMPTAEKIRELKKQAKRSLIKEETP